MLRDFVPPVIYKTINFLRDTSSLKRESLKYHASENDYDAEKYWDDRHKEYGYDTLKGVGNAGKSENENYSEYTAARYIFKSILEELELDRDNDKILELGVGTGFYTKIFHNLGYRHYRGVDITASNFSKIELDAPNYSGNFQKLDIGTQKIEQSLYRLIFMIDVSQHITNDEKLIFCLKNNVEKNLESRGVFIVTDELKNKKFSFYEISRTLEFYEKSLGMSLLHSPVQFRDKYIFSFIKK